MKEQLDGNFNGKSLTASKCKATSTAVLICHIAHIWMLFGINKGFWEIGTRDLPFCSWSQKQNSHLLSHAPLYPQPRRMGSSLHFPLWVWPHLVHPLLYSESGQVCCLWLRRELTRRNWFVCDHMKLMRPSWQMAFQPSCAYCWRSQSSPQVTAGTSFCLCEEWEFALCRLHPSIMLNHRTFFCVCGNTGF